MAEFKDHVQQSGRNLQFLQGINEHCSQHYDWQVTACFYTALHLVNAHLATQGQQYRKHKDVKDVLNPYNKLSVVRLPETEYSAYVTLQSLSRRARYLVSEKDDKIGSTDAALTYEKHLGKALRHLAVLAEYFTDKYGFTLPVVHLTCSMYKFDVGKVVLSKTA